MTTLLAASAAAPGCTKTREVNRVDPEVVRDLDYRFDEDDARATAEEMISDALTRPWIDRWLQEYAKQPVIIVGTVRNDTSDYIDTKLFTKQFERALLNSDRVRLVAARDERGEIRDERLQGQEFSRPETVKKMAFELGADLMLIGRVGENIEVSRNRRQRVVYYQVNLELIDVESNEKVWIGEKQIEKQVRDRG
ncbi:MAG: penicillin-binding protein activator LpoB [Planctomycetota bacterium]|nr:penicillin-binding protein activator LpoB [Planctomycetota bacterium]